MTIRKIPILVTDDDSLVHLAVKKVLEPQFEVHTARNSDEAYQFLSKTLVSAVLLDIAMRTPNEGLEFLKRMTSQLSPCPPVIILSGKTDFATLRQAIQLGAFDYISKDFDPDDLKLTVKRATEHTSLIKRTEQQDFEATGYHEKHPLIGASRGMKAVLTTIEKFRNAAGNVLITGETGTGKEAVARQLRGRLKDGTLAPFIAVDSSTIQSTMAESLLFGHEKGAFTGADRARKGVFEEADGGIVYFDEIGNMPLEIQTKLLRVIEEKEVLPLGSVRVISTEFRVVCATNADLSALVRSGKFKGDLYQRISVLPVEVPPLRERKEDLPLLIDHLVARERPDLKISFTDSCLNTLKAYSWPGNVRELANVILYVIAMATTSEIDTSDLPPRLRDFSAQNSDQDSHSTFYEKIACYEKKILEEETGSYTGSVSELALKLGMDRSHLYAKFKQFGIQPPKARG